MMCEFKIHELYHITVFSRREVHLWRLNYVTDLKSDHLKIIPFFGLRYKLPI